MLRSSMHDLTGQQHLFLGGRHEPQAQVAAPEISVRICNHPGIIFHGLRLLRERPRWAARAAVGAHAVSRAHAHLVM